MDAGPPAVWEDELVTASQADFCAWPGYLILRLKGPERRLSLLATPEAEALGRALARLAEALERATGAERVYLLSFAELDRQFHIHLLPRTAALRRAWAEAAGLPGDAPVDGAALFQWVRAAIRRAADLPAGTRAMAEVLADLRGALAATAASSRDMEGGSPA